MPYHRGLTIRNQEEEDEGKEPEGEEELEEETDPESLGSSPDDEEI